MKPIVHFRGRYYFLSNFSPSPVVYDNIIYPTVEHAYQAAKTLDVHWRDVVRAAPTAARAKGLGRRAPLRPHWDDIRLDLMRDLVCKKFANNPLRGLLADTFPAELIEFNTWGDVFWGVCKGSGENHLGKILMDTRSQIIASYKGE